MKENNLNIPNALSIFRIVLIPFIVWAYSLNRRIFTVVLIAVSAVTDVIDGVIARKFDMVTALGKALDPVADKLTLLAMLILTCDYLKSPPIIVLSVIFAAKEIVVGVEGLIVIKKTGTTYSANILGKATTVCLYVNVVIHLLWTGIPSWASTTLIIISIFFVFISLAVYTKQNLQRIKSTENENDE